MGPVCKGAILDLGLPLQVQHGPGDFPQAQLSDVPGGRAQGVQGIRGIEIRNVPEIVLDKIRRRVTAAAHQQHEAHAVLQRPAVLHLEVQVVQLL